MSRSTFRGMRKAGEIAAASLAYLLSMLQPGITTEELNKAAGSFLASRNARSAVLYYGGFPKNLCISVNDQVAHGIPGNYVLKEGDVISLDIAVEYDGYYSDAARTCAIGTVENDVDRLIQQGRACFFEALEYIRAGCWTYDVTAAIERRAEASGYSVIKGLSGHAIGEELQMPPYIPNHTRELCGKGSALKPGMFLAVEPILCLGDGKIQTSMDGWTIKTADGSISTHYEDTVAVTEGAPIVLTVF